MACGDRRLMYVPLLQKDESLCCSVGFTAGDAAPLTLVPVLGSHSAPRGRGARSVGCPRGGNRKRSATAAEKRSQLAEKCWPVLLFIAGSEAASGASASEE